MFASGGAAMALTQNASGQKMAWFDAAAKEFNVPVSVLVALSYNESRLETHAGASIDGGYGLMDLRTYTPAQVSGRDGRKVAPAPKKSADYYTLDRAAKLLHVSADKLKSDDKLNIRGGAAVLADEAKRLNGGKTPAAAGDWYAAVAEFSGDSATSTEVADSVFASIKAGLSVTTFDGQKLTVPSTDVQPNKGAASVLNLKAKSLGNTNAKQTKLPGQNPECPSTLDCRFVPAAYAQNSDDPADYGNYDPAHRPKDMKLKYIFIHDTEGSYESAISHFQDPTSYVSAQYVVRSSDGAVTQMVRNSDVSWGVGDWYDNMHGINIENEGIAANGAAWYTPEMYQTNARLVRYLANKYHIPLDRQHILGHDNIPTLTAARLPGQHWDPGPYWDWNYFMRLVRGENPNVDPHYNTHYDQPTKGDVITLSPDFATNKPPVTDCQTGTCVDLPSQGTSFVYLRKSPDANAPLLSDPYVHADNSDGTTRDDDWGDKAPSGFKYVVADVQGDWMAIWFGGQKGWFYNPSGTGHVAYRSPSAVVKLKNGKTSIPVYGAAYPEASAYPSTIPLQQFDELYHISAGQKYATTGEWLPNDYFYDATVDYSKPDDHMIVRGHTKYYQISLNHRIGYVKASDVTVNR
jgi:N-acetyl-anhydromuramyl-L-alanine amidase AmpD